MATGMLPADGELRLGPVALRAGRQIASILSGDPVAWATFQGVPDAGRVWAALCDARQQTGLVPFLHHYPALGQRGVRAPRRHRRA